MNYINEIFWRADIQQIREFLLHGTDGKADPRPYKERIESAHDEFYARLQKDYKNRIELEEITNLVYNYVGKTEEVYLEIGLQIGAILAVQTTQNLKNAFKDEYGRRMDSY